MLIRYRKKTRSVCHVRTHKRSFREHPRVPLLPTSSCIGDRNMRFRLNATWQWKKHWGTRSGSSIKLLNITGSVEAILHMTLGTGRHVWQHTQTRTGAKGRAWATHLPRDIPYLNKESPAFRTCCHTNTHTCQRPHVAHTHSASHLCGDAINSEERSRRRLRDTLYVNNIISGCIVLIRFLLSCVNPRLESLNLTGWDPAKETIGALLHAAVTDADQTAAYKELRRWKRP